MPKEASTMATAISRLIGETRSCKPLELDSDLTTDDVRARGKELPKLHIRRPQSIDCPG